MQKILWIALFVISAASCKKDKEKTPSQDLLNIAYGMEASQTMDIYLPANRNTVDTKLLILLHGGSWSEGDKSELTEYVSQLKQSLPDYAIANINYRLFTGSSNMFPAQETDVKMAVEFLLSHSMEYLYSKNLALLGASAGGHLALLQAYKYPGPVQAKAVISLFGPTDLTRLYNNVDPAIQHSLETLIGGTPSANPSLYSQSSPVTFVMNNSCPTLLFHGAQDPIVPLEQSTSLSDSLESKGVTHELVVYPAEGHAWEGPALADTFQRIIVFLQEHVQ